MPILLWFSVIILAALYITGPIVDPDLWWHITVGKFILANKEIPSVDHWNMFAVGKPWVAYSWLPEIIFAFTEKYFSITGLIILKTIFAITFAFSICYVLSKVSKDFYFGTLLGLYSTLAVFNHFTLRPQSLVWIYFIWLIYFGYKISIGELRKSNYLAIFIIIILWSNTHLTVPLGILVLALILNKINLLKKVLPLAFLASLITPNYGGEWLTLFRKAIHPFKYAAISEFRPGTITDYSTVFLLLLTILLLLFWHYRPKKISISLMVLFSGAIIIALTVIKFIPFAIIITSFLMTIFWQETSNNMRAYENLSEAFFKLKALINKIPIQGLTFVIVCLCIVQINRIAHNKISYERIPIEAVKFIKDNQLKPPILHGFGQGGYVMYSFSDKNGKPEILVPIDGRTNINDQKIWKAFMASLLGNKNWKDYFDLVNPNTVLWVKDSPLNTILELTKEWKKVFESGNEQEGFVVYSKVNGTGA